MAETRLQRIKAYGIGFVVLVVLFVLPLLYLYGVLWFSEKALPWLFLACLVTFAVCVFVLLPLSIFRRMRSWTGAALYLISFLFGAMLFAFSCLVTYELWGTMGLIVGLVIMGIGVVPIAFLSSLFHGEWALLGYVVLGAVITFGIRLLGMRIAVSNGRRDETIGEEWIQEDLPEDEEDLSEPMESWEPTHDAANDDEQVSTDVDTKGESVADYIYLTPEEEEVLRELFGEES